MSGIGERLALLFIVGALLLNFPVLAIFNLPVTVWGVPILYLYLFGVWVLGITAVLLLVRSTWDGER